jgi:hypothetical protein
VELFFLQSYGFSGENTPYSTPNWHPAMTKVLPAEQWLSKIKIFEGSQILMGQ